jgi:DNA-binding MarR family transcriptional regulator
MVRSNAERDGGQFSYEGLDRVLHEKARLGILTALVTQPKGVYFTDLKAQCALTDGNLSRHVQVLNEAGIVEIWKGYEGKKPQTLIRLTAEGRQEFVQYLAELQRVIADARVRPTRAIAKRFDAPPGFMPA